jgi:hypothetical protein
MPPSFSSSVRGAVSLLLLFTLTSFQTASAQLQGKWVCDLKTGRLDPHTTYQMECAGYLFFKADKTLESTCIDGFFPTGALWEINGNTLILKDSDGQAFADFEIKKLEGSQLSLLRNGVTYHFKKE